MTEDKQENNKRPRLELKKTFDLGKIVINKQIKDSENDDLKETKEKETNLNKFKNPETKDFKKKTNNKITSQDKSDSAKEEKNSKLTNFKLIKVPKKQNERRKGKLTISEALDENNEKVR